MARIPRACPNGGRIYCDLTMMFRVMVRGEDGMEFCYANNIEDDEVHDVCAEAVEQYPCGEVWYEAQTE